MVAPPPPRCVWQEQRRGWGWREWAGAWGGSCTSKQTQNPTPSRQFHRTLTAIIPHPNYLLPGLPNGLPPSNHAPGPTTPPAYDDAPGPTTPPASDHTPRRPDHAPAPTTPPPVCSRLSSGKLSEATSHWPLLRPDPSGGATPVLTGSCGTCECSNGHPWSLHVFDQNTREQPCTWSGMAEGDGMENVLAGPGEPQTDPWGQPAEGESIAMIRFPVSARRSLRGVISHGGAMTSFICSISPWKRAWR